MMILASALLLHLTYLLYHYNFGIGEKNRFEIIKFQENSGVGQLINIWLTSGEHTI